MGVDADGVHGSAGECWLDRGNTQWLTGSRRSRQDGRCGSLVPLCPSARSLSRQRDEVAPAAEGGEVRPRVVVDRKHVRNGLSPDFPVVPFPARYGSRATVTREPLLGTYATDPFKRKESVNVRAALRSHTIWAAHQLFLNNKIVYRAPNSPIQAPN